MANQTSSVNHPISFQNIRHVEPPLHDEWGIYDPQQAGVQALLRKLLSPAGAGDTAKPPVAPVEK